MIIKVTDPCRPLEFDLARPLEIEVGCGKGKFLTARAQAHPECDFLGIERMLERVRLFDGKCRRGHIPNAHVLRLEALYTFHYLLPAHHARTVYVFFPDPWPKKKHHSHRLFGPLFRTALWKRLEIGGKLEFATDHKEYFDEVCAGFATDGRFERVEPMPTPGSMDGVRDDVPRAGLADPFRRLALAPGRGFAAAAPYRTARGRAARRHRPVRFAQGSITTLVSKPVIR